MHYFEDSEYLFRYYYTSNELCPESALSLYVIVAHNLAYKSPYLFSHLLCNRLTVSTFQQLEEFDSERLWFRQNLQSTFKICYPKTWNF